MSFFSEFGRPRMYVDLGTSNTLVMSSEHGLVVNEPSVIAYREDSIGGRHVVAVGSSAKSKLGRAPESITAEYPLKGGVVADIETTEAMLRYFFSRAERRFNPFRPDVVISLPHQVTGSEMRAVRDVALAAGAHAVTLIGEPMAAAVGAGLKVEGALGNMVIDIGGGTTEIAIISLCGIVHCEAVRVGGHAFDDAIVAHVRKHFNLVIGHETAERVKIEVGSALADSPEMTTKIRGVDFASGLPREISIRSTDLYEALAPLIFEIAQAARRSLEMTPPELVADILIGKVALVGGGALLRDMGTRLSRELGLEVVMADDPLLAIADGGRVIMENAELLERVAIN